MRLGSEGPRGLASSEGMTETEASPVDSNILLCRQTTAVTLSVAVYVPTILDPCTACALCKPGEPRPPLGEAGAGGWAEGARSPQPP